MIMMIIIIKDNIFIKLMITRSQYRNNRKKEIKEYKYKYYMNELIELYSHNKLIANTIAIYSSWIFIHFVSSHLYSTYCTNYSLWGFISSPIIVSTPVCRGLSWIIYTGSDTIFNMWNVLGTFLLTYVSS